MRRQRVTATLTAVEGKRGRRTRKASHQAGSPGSDTSRDCPSPSVVSRLGYALRTGSPCRSARRLFYSLVGCFQPPAREPTVSSDMYVPLGKGRRRRFVKFVKGPTLAEEVSSFSPADVALSRPPERLPSVAPLLRATSTPWIGYDYRVTGTFLESERLVELRRLREEALVAGRRSLSLSPERVEWFNSDPSFMRWVGQSSGYGVESVFDLSYPLPPLFKTRIGTYQLSLALHQHREERLSVSAMVYEHLLGLAEFLPPLEDGTLPEAYLKPETYLLFGERR